MRRFSGLLSRTLFCGASEVARTAKEQWTICPTLRGKRNHLAMLLIPGANMNATRKQWILLVATISVLVISIFAASGVFRLRGWYRSPETGELDIALMAPLLFGIAGATAFAVEVLVFVILLVVRTREARKRNSLTLANFLARAAQWLSSVYGRTIDSVRRWQLMCTLIGTKR